MSRRSAELQDADALTRRARFEIGREIRDARVSAGASLRAAAARVSMSHTQLGRIERGAIARLTVEQVSRGCAAVGLRLMVRAVPGADPALDAGQLAVLNRLRSKLLPDTPYRTEVPLPLAGDRRAWDAVASLGGQEVPVEAEARIRDVQAVDRRCTLKRRDAGIDVMILLIADTEANRRLLRMHREALRASFPLDSRAVLEAIRGGRAPRASGILVL